MLKILIIEDDKSIDSILSDELNQWGYQTKSIEDFSTVYETFEKFEPNLVLMDISLPYYNGFYWTQRIRQKSNVPVVFISSHSESMDMVQAIQFGADDFITKPIDITVTIAKIQAILRRTYDYTLDSDKLAYGELTLNLSSAKLEGEEFSLSLTRTELLILDILFNMKGQIAKREDIINHCWQGDDFIDDNTLAVNMTRLRKKLAGVGLDEFIQTKKGIGYYLQ
ncbi:response regulator transcription factor [Mogibacterium neglectum]|jgi:Response regulators consisting of a CheY-like receiver domain and a winged-helix DNA-binding domain|uniref:response regulator transcription factor n=1 Tax=Mogibacterium neglectum TaxID=114528 RepID=UPI00272BAF38|nr:response regulator transcription factor [Mogibacterium neglectum]WLD76981.1 response regulator transcription factor [Mogibacterium neglectum]